MPRGKVLGGSSTINGMVYARGHRLDYDDWAQKGLRGWGYADVLPYFKKSETSWLGEGKYHGGSGELDVPRPRLRPDVLRAEGGHHRCRLAVHRGLPWRRLRGRAA